MSVTINGNTGIATPGIANSEGYTGDGLTIAAGAPAGALQIDASGSAGLGVTPSAWLSPWRAAEVGHIGNALVSGGLNSLGIASNAILTPTSVWKYGANGAANFFGVGNAGGQFAWYTAPSGTAGNPITFTQAMTLDASGNLLVGTSSQAPLVGGGKYFTLYNNSNATLSVQAVDGTNDRSATLELLSSGNGYSISQIVYGDTDTTPATPSPLVFAGYHNGTRTERMRLDSFGNLLVGNPSAILVRLYAKGETSDSSRSAFALDNAAGTPLVRVRNDGVFYTGNAAYSPYNNTTGSAANVVVGAAGDLYRSTSSIKYKKNVQDAVHGLTDLLTLRAVTYEGKSKADEGKIFGGLIAEEVHDAGLTEFVQYAEDGTPDALAYGNMVSLCVKAIQEQQAIINELKARIEQLEAK